MTYKLYGSRFWTTIALFAVLLPMGSVAQLQTQPPQIPETLPRSSSDETTWEAQQRRDMQKQANLQRQQDIRKDTEKLLELATELKHYVDKSNENTLSLEVIRKADQIEKLAKSVKEKMKGQ